MLVTSRKIGQSIMLRHESLDPQFQTAVLTIDEGSDPRLLILAVQIGDQWFCGSYVRNNGLVLKLGPNVFANVMFVKHQAGNLFRIGIDVDDCIKIRRLDEKIDPSIDDMLSLTPGDGSAIGSKAVAS